MSDRDLKGKGRATEATYVVISGGTGANSIASAFGVSPAFVLPVSDDGGSSAEILRCFGGPSIGDIRSRLSRLIPLTDPPTARDQIERLAIYNLMSYRFPSDAPERIVKDMWSEIVEGRSSLWEGIGEDKKECIRAFLVHFNTLNLRRAHKRFSFRNFSLGNGFLTGARDLFGSLPSAIFLFKSIAGCAPGVQVIPVINTNQTVTIAASLQNGSTLVGQCTISHPVISGGSPVAALGGITPASSPAPWARGAGTGTGGGGGTPTARQAPVSPSIRTHFRRDSRTFDLDILSPSEPSSMRNSLEEPRASPFTAARSRMLDLEKEVEDLSVGNIGYRKGEGEVPLESRIERIFYIKLYGQEIYPEPNLEYLEALQSRDILTYSCGSLYTSIIPCLALRGLASAIATSKSLKAKVVLLNSKNDRETPEYTASEYLKAMIDALRRYDKPRRGAEMTIWESRRLVTHLVYLEGGQVEIDNDELQMMGIKLIAVPAQVHAQSGTPMFTPPVVEWAMEQILSEISDPTRALAGEVTSEAPCAASWFMTGQSRDST